MNEHVKYGLNLYVKDTDPQCAILLKGDWGCGKTHFIKEWIKEQPQVNGSACDVIYVSLFGLSTIKGLKEAINKAISPIMYKVEKYGKDILKAAAKVVLKYESSIADIKDAKFQYELNPLDLLSQINLSENSKEYKLFVFDDVERCDIPLKELFGFIDYLFEQVGSKVVLIVGKTDLQGDVWNEMMRKYQEKIIGREYEIAADIDAAVQSFVDEIKVDHPISYEFIKHHQDAVVMVWEASKFKNLRSIRQSIRSVSEILESLNEGAETAKFRFFVNYLAYSLEYYNGDKNVFLDLSVHIIGRYFGNDSPARKMIDKYNIIWQKLGFKLFDLEFLDDIKASVIDGKDITDVLNNKISAVVERSLSARLKEIIYLENRDVDLLIREAKVYLNAPVVNVSEYLFVAYVLCYWEEQGVCILKKTFENDCLNKLRPWLKANIKPSQMAQIEMQIKRSLSIQDYEGKNNRFTWLSREIEKAITDLKNNVKEPIFNQMERLSNESIDEVITLMSQPDIWSIATYSSQSLFNRLDVRKFCQCVQKLNNMNKMKLADAMAARYEQNYGINDYMKIFGGEIAEISELRSILENDRVRTTKMTRVAYDRLIEPLNHALKRLNNNK